jgi:hypothetical protein
MQFRKLLANMAFERDAPKAARPSARVNGGRVLQSNIIAEARWFASFREEAGCATYAATPELRVKTRAMSRGVAPSATKPRNRRSSETVWSAASIFATRD